MHACLHDLEECAYAWMLCLQGSPFGLLVGACQLVDTRSGRYEALSSLIRLGGRPQTASIKDYTARFGHGSARLLFTPTP